LPTFLDFHSIGKYTEDDLKQSQKEPRDESGVEVLNTFYDMDSGTMFCLVDARDRLAVERHHSKFGMKYDWITSVKMTSEYDDGSKSASVEFQSCTQKLFVSADSSIFKQKICTRNISLHQILHS
jgi:hypothetical protein